MFIQHLQLRRFRNYREASIATGPGIHVFHGLNAQGKTNLLEAIYFLALGRSFRTSRLTDLIAQGDQDLFVESQFESSGVTQNLKIHFNGKEKQVIHNETICSSLSALVGLLPVIMIAPDDDLIKGGPQARRSFLDLVLSQGAPKYMLTLSRYLRAVKQRNILLRSQTLRTIESWEEEMASAAAYLVTKRRQALKHLTPLAEELHRTLSEEKDPLHLRYIHRTPEELSLVELTSFFKKLYATHREKEMHMKMTLYGPHRDDLGILIGDKEARVFGSEGQKRTAVMALRLASWQLLHEKIKEKPLLLIDDFAVHLDRERQKNLLRFLERAGQVFITSVEPLTGATRLSTVAQGCLQ